MGEVLTIISGKGGTGKTSICAGIASCLAAEGFRVLAIDCDVGMRNLDISLAMAECAILPFTSVMDKSYRLSDATQHPDISGLFLLTSPVMQVPEELDEEIFCDMLKEVREQFDWCIIDAPAGVGAGFHLATRGADCCAVVATCDPASLRDGARAADILILNGMENLRVVVNRIKPKMLKTMKSNIDDVMDGVGLPLLGIVPEDESVPLAAAWGKPLIMQTGTGASRACLNIARRLSGKKIPLLKL